MICSIAWPIICFIIILETICSFLLFGLRSSRSSVGAYVAKANEAKVSIIKFIHNIWIGAKTYCLMRLALIIVQTTATTFTVSWNWMNLRIES